MSSQPPVWTDGELAEAAAASTADFRAERLAATNDWTTNYEESREKFESLFSALSNLAQQAVTPENLAVVYAGNLGEALRYLAGPPISDDDLKVIADVSSLNPRVLGRDPDSLLKVFSVLERVVDPHRFPWVKEGRAPSESEREAALLASSMLLAAQRIATSRRNDGKTDQETAVKSYLTSIGFVEVPAVTINTLVRGPQEGEFCSECQLGARKADVVVRLYDTRLMPIECKVSNSSTNSVKRLNNDAAVKADYWLKQFGISQVVPAALLSGVFNILNLKQAQERGLSIFWRHSPEALGEFIQSTRAN